MGKLPSHQSTRILKCMVTGTYAAHLYRKRNKIDFRGNTLRQQAGCAVAFTCHVTECPSIPAKLGFFDQYFIDPLIASSGDTITHTNATVGIHRDGPYI